ncbi:MAG: lipid A deacylase LpxR family protein [Gemmatimonadetes bacterium]|nr:lipid A deacylase LpxR family protein [Gemmatimonadota bacterium]MYI45326.1 lipid A deacylase LpxR family protein [Gemmatimonadota bacterium]
MATVDWNQDSRLANNRTRHSQVPLTITLLVLTRLGIGLPASGQEADFSGLHLHVEQDLFVKCFGLGGDQNYTMGLGIQATGRSLRHFGGPQHAIDWLLTRAIPRVRLTPDRKWDPTFHSFTLVGSAFTPDSLLATEPVRGDRPYASLLGLVSSRTWVNGAAGQNDRYAITTELGLGFLGLGVSRKIQTKIHDWLEADPPSGWDHQISNGGEFTGFYHVGVRRRLTPYFARGTKKSHEFSLDGDLWLGYYTNASFGLTGRIGEFYSRYYEFASAPIASVAQALNAAPNRSEFFAFGAARVRGVVYNALLQGAFFKDSPYTLSNSEIERAVFELEGGIHGAISLRGRYSLYATWVMVAGRSPEFDTAFSRWHWWGSLQVGLMRSTPPTGR